MFERLTIKTDICIEPENEIVYHNPNDPEGMYNILDLAECLYSGGEAEAGILMEISRRLVAYEDTGLTPKQIEDMKKCLKRYDDDRIAAQQECGSVCEDAIEMHQQIKALTADKDEQAGRLMRYDTALKQAKEALQEAWGDDGSIAVGNRILETIKAIDALLGGKEDEK